MKQRLNSKLYICIIIIMNYVVLGAQIQITITPPLMAAVQSHSCDRAEELYPGVVYGEARARGSKVRECYSKQTAQSFG
ncbi:hypothetical protein FHEFKHOI_01924 [Candidatus Methanoperedenaceae archaeon GB50]|nr:hypothetical protein AIOGIFDO_01911 [Candidatus Methanoperedenaceae archaeon GB37]CAD7776394.1 hypothetical protein FHEFKHOI_01924 [Candidatus Methanoperedenaceae archaeon GB50]